jgi:tRNA 2-(methylsulfanyl)-N6-isopentenyladenosine37 hydroxylase
LRPVPASTPYAPLALPLTATDPRWLPTALANLDAIYCDHLHCERKAAQSALSLVRSYPQHPRLVEAVARLAHEETSHVIQVSQLMARQGTYPRYDTGDDYAQALRRHIRRREPERLLYSLLIFALIEARSAQRLDLLAGALPDPETAALYRALATAEVRHRDTFLRLAAGVVDQATYQERLAQLAQAEADIMAGLPIRARIH